MSTRASKLLGEDHGSNQSKPAKASRVKAYEAGPLKKDKQYFKYIQTASGFIPTGDIQTVSTLPAGVYRVEDTMQGPSFVIHEASSDNLLRFKDSRQQEVLDEISKFWEAGDRYKSMGFGHKRGILLEGSPGTGKSCLLRLVSEEIVKQGDVVIICRSPYLIREALQRLRDIEKNRRCLIMLEDLDSIAGEHELLQLLDGDAQLDKVLILATTNYIDRIPDRLKRPGRFDRQLRIGAPPEEGRRAYFKSKLPDDMDIVEQYTAVTDGFTFAQLREFLVGVYVLQQPVEEVVARLRSGKVEESKIDDDVLDTALRGSVELPEDQQSTQPSDDCNPMSETAAKKLAAERLFESLTDVNDEDNSSESFQAPKQRAVGIFDKDQYQP